MAFRTCLARWSVTVACSIPGVALADPSTAQAVSPIARQATDSSSPHSGASLATATEKSGAIRIDSVSVPPSVSARTRAALHDAIALELSQAKIDAKNPVSSVSVSLVQLRRYIGPDGPAPRTVCIVDVALHDPHGVLVGSLRGRASGAVSETRDVLTAAARSALSRLPEATRLAGQVRQGQGAGTEQTYARR
jgi:hypothetical protein